ncbi:hypothetical protein SKAU_G00066480 [Synaphobranchus kaupii]|uniref:DNA topoisomerase n=1 Tax=Synaphobranchus kaupii TaxID=118154 RepID=A0A9Q1JAW3_SYNKA|nr:hypothetical protein SKAU_G00066480 [Synaphobranchus kaupii]
MTEEKKGNFRIEPPGLFRGRGEHPKQGMLKRRIQPEDVIINCSKQSRIPEPPAGHRWKEVCHDNTVTWLTSWTENIQGSCKYIMLNASSKLKGEKDWEKYEVAWRLNSYVDQIQSQYCQDMNSKEMLTRQRATALYFIDKLALKAGNEKEADEMADTVGCCCSLRVEHITAQAAGREQTSTLNKYLSSLMPGLTAKVFRTYNASITLQNKLRVCHRSDGQAEKLLAYNRANRAVAVLYPDVSLRWPVLPYVVRPCDASISDPQIKERWSAAAGLQMAALSLRR